MRILSADWVLPVEGEPIENGAVAIEDGRIAAVGTAAELGVGERYPEAVILPGFVNAHTHLEYAVYAGFGDGLSFGPWISTHVERKRRLERADMEAIARLGAAECLRSGITTVGDLAFSGASAAACAESRAASDRLPRGVRHRRGPRRCGSSRRNASTSASALSEQVGLGVSPHAPYTCSTEVYAACASLDLPVATHLNESGDELDWLLRGEGPWQPFSELLVEPDGQSGIRRLAAAGLARRAHGGRALREGRRRGDRPPRETTASRSRIVRARTRCSAVGSRRFGRFGPPDCASGSAPTASRRCRRTTSSRSCGRRSRLARARDERADAISASDALELATLGGAKALGLEARASDRSSPASARMSRSSPFPARRIYHGRIRLRLSSTAALRSESWLPSSTARHGTREEVSNGTS